MNARLAVHVPTHQLPELQRAARALLRTPLITSLQRDDFRLILKWETVLRKEFGQKLGYRLDVSRSAARLLRRPATLSSERGARLGTGRLLGRWGYVYLCLTLAALEQPGHQVLASDLTARISQIARGDERLQLDSTEFAQRRAFRDAVRYLEEIGVLVVRDGNVESLLSDGQVLWDIDRDAAAMCMVAAPSVLRSVTSVADFINEPVASHREARSRRARQLLNRRIIDQPVVYLDELTPDEVELAWRNRRREADNLTRLTGCSIELRREGMALIDHSMQPLDKGAFPGANSVAQAALLWLRALLESVKPTTEEIEAHSDGDDTATTGRTVDNDVASRLWHDMLVEYGDRLGKDARERPDYFADLVLALLRRYRLADAGPDGVTVAAFASRFRAAPSRDDSEAGGSAFDQAAMF